MEIKLSHSRLNTFRKCPKMYWWRYVYGIEPIREPDSFIIGSLLHTICENYYKNKLTRQQAVDAAWLTVKAIIADCAPEEQESWLIMSHTAIAMFEFMPNYLLDPVDTSMVEKSFVMPIFTSDNDKITYEGHIDRYVGCKNMIRELKTTINPDMFVRYAAVSPQVTGYVLGCKRVFGHDPKGVTYDLIRKPLLRKKQNEDCEQFCQRIRDDYRTRPEFYYRREHTYRSPQQLAQFEIDIKSIGIDILGKMKVYETNKVVGTELFWRNHEACFSRGECPYYKICFTKDSMTEQIFYKKIEHTRNHDIAEDIE